MQVVETVFWISFTVLVFAYGGYTIFLLPFRRKKNHTVLHPLPSCTLLIAAYNEGSIIRTKIDNSLRLSYPGAELTIIVVADGSTDNTVSICKEYHQVKLLFEPERSGKVAAIQRALPQIDTEIVVFSDANAILNEQALVQLSGHFADSRTGAVSGEKLVLDAASGAATEGLYWRYESWLKRQDANFYSLVGAAGELLAVRSSLYSMLPEDTILDDFMQSMLIATKGYRVAYEPAATAVELPSTTLKDEFERKVRISAGGFQAMARLRDPISLIKQPRLTLLYCSHRVLRWAVAPFLLLLLLPLNLILASGPGIYKIMLSLQVLFYFLAIIGNEFSKRGKKVGALAVPSYFFLMNLAVILGLKRYLLKQQSATWEKIPRFHQ